MLCGVRLRHTVSSRRLTAPARRLEEGALPLPRTRAAPATASVSMSSRRQFEPSARGCGALVPQQTYSVDLCRSWPRRCAAAVAASSRAFSDVAACVPELEVRTLVPGERGEVERDDAARKDRASSSQALRSNGRRPEVLVLCALRERESSGDDPPPDDEVVR